MASLDNNESTLKKLPYGNIGLGYFALVVVVTCFLRESVRSLEVVKVGFVPFQKKGCLRLLLGLSHENCWPYVGDCRRRSVSWLAGSPNA